MGRSFFPVTGLSVAVLTLAALAAPGADAGGSKADYERANNLRNLTQNKVFRARVQPHWFAKNTRFWYRNDLPDGAREFIRVDAEKGVRGAAFDHEKLAAALAGATGKEVRAERLPIERLEFHDTEPRMIFSAEGKNWECDLIRYSLRESKVAPASGPSLTAGRTPRPSRTTGAETAITFVNRTKQDVEVYWIDPDGQRKRYATVKAGERHEQHTYAGHVWLVVDPDGRTLAVFEATEKAGTAVIDGEGAVPDGREERRPRQPERGISPDGKWRAFVRDYNVFLREQQTGEEFALSAGATADDAYTDRELFWAPDGRKLAALRTKRGGDRKVSFVESSPADQVQPKLHSFDYLKPGDPVPQPKPHLFDIASRKEIPVSDELFPNPWSVTDVRWEPDSRRFTFLYNQRGHQVLRIVAVDAATGEARAIVDEQSRTFIDYAGKQFVRYLDDTGEILWMSERDGWNHLYLYDARSGAVKNPVTRGEWVVRGVDRVDPKNRQVWFRAGGMFPEQDPYYVHYCQINFDGTGLVQLTAGDGTHSVEYSPDGRFLIDTYSRVDLPPVTELWRTEDGKLICELERADWSALLATGWKAPERFAAKGRDGKTDIFGVIFRPTQVDPGKKYPVIEDIYAGPQSAFVPKGFQSYHSQQSLAELGFIVVKIDGMGTSNRSKAFHDICWKNLGDAGLPDRILWMKDAEVKYPYLDLDRVGVYGTSAGGQNSLRALLAHPDFYKVGVSACGCHDNRMDKIWWNELWMGWPVGPHYDEQSNVTQAHRLQGKVLLIVGEMDKNVDPASTLQVVNRLVKADKDFDLLVVPGAGHGMGGAYGARRMQDFFVRHLLGVEPRHEGGATQ
jgi:dipeptidyl-peptidase 4